ncbi:MAG TPA: hypothetical protein VE177_05660 [Candidatus Binatus sp.]|nr:hypothetical protein [Candidatus Binatus sp.]
MTKIIADDLGKEKAEELSEFIASHASESQIERHGTKVDVTGQTNKSIKFMINKFLRKFKLDEYGVLDTSGVFEIVHTKDKKHVEWKHENLKSSMPYSSLLANAQGRPLYAPWMRPSDLIEWHGRSPEKRLKKKK